MSDDVTVPHDLAAVRTLQDLLDELNRLRINAARHRGKVRLSLQDLEVASGIPKSSLANYLTGRTLMPADVLDRLVVALGVDAAQVRQWAEAWERIMDAQLQAGTQAVRNRHGDTTTGTRRDPSTGAGNAGGGTGGRDGGGTAAALREITALQSVAATAVGLGQDQHAEFVAGLEGLAKDLAEFGLMVGDVRALTARLQSDLHRQAADRRDDRDHHLRHAAQLRLIRDGLQVIEQRTRPQQDTDRVFDRDHPPYRGLWPFQEDQAGVFYGRERLTAELTGRVEQRLSGVGMLVVTGASGAGKSSLVRAGLLPAMDRGQLAVAGSTDWPRLIITPGTAAIDELVIQLATLAGVDAASLRLTISQRPTEARLLARQAVLAHAARLPIERREACRAGGRLVLVVDQFEELFTLADDPGDAQQRRQAYIDALVAIATADSATGHPPGLVLLTIRGDFLDRCAVYPELVPVLQDGQFVVGPMSVPELRRAITGPAVACGVQVEDGLPEEILAELRTLPEAAQIATGALPLLSQTMLLTWQRCESNRLTRRGYGATGGVSEVIATSAEDVYNRLTGPEREITRQLFERMTTVGADGAPARRQLLRAELFAVVADAKHRGRVESVLDAFTAKRLVVANIESIEIAHDVVLLAWPRLRKWLEGDRNDRLIHAQLRQDAATWQARDHDASFLYRGAQLAMVRRATADWSAVAGPRLALTLAEQSFLAASDRHARRISRIRQSITAGLVTLALAACIGAVASVTYAVNADRQRAVALSRQLAAQSQSIHQHDPVTARRLALSAWAVAPTDEARSSMNSLITEQSSTLIGHVSPVYSVVFSPDGRKIAAGGRDGTIRLWDVATHRPVGAPMTGHSERIYAMAFSPDGKFLASAAGFGGDTKLWNLATGDVADIPRGAPEGGRITTMSFSPDSRLLATTSSSRGQLWDVSTGRFRWVSKEESAYIAVTFGPDGRLLAVPRSSGKVLVSAPDRTKEPRDEIVTHSAEEYQSAWFSPNGDRLAVVAGDGHVQLWDIPKKERIGKPFNRHVNQYPPMALSPDGKFLITAATDSTAQVWDTATQTPLDGSLSGHTDTIRAAAFSPDGALLATASDDETVRLWNPATLDPAAGPLANTSYLANSLGFSAGGKLLSADLGEEAVRLRRPLSGDSNGGRQTGDTTSHYETGLRPERVLTNDIHQIAISPDGLLLAILTSDKVQVFDTATGIRMGKPTQLPPGFASGPIAFSPDRKLLAVARGSGLHLISLTGTDPSNIPLPNHVHTILSVTFSPDGRLLASAGPDGTVRLWDPITRQAVGAPLTGHTNEATTVAFSPDGRLLASAGSDGTVRLWDPITRQAVGAPLTGHTGAVTAMTFSPDGRLLATAGDDRTLRLWTTATWQPVSTPLTGHTAAVVAVAFSPDSSTVATASMDTTIRLWHPAHYVEPVEYICSIVGPPTSTEWRGFAPGEPLPRVCA
ncbi:nSTAND1 domain-containing NTPase [Micromonospora ureilytica]|uniref:WD40 repeat protein/transcriptional regulator with XRE-family HTH domain n=1 Tax=Micromonospora ureilytica TaxID=709868 RepID=A0ABS0JKL8_9ACTN|nr:AAA family ATPase [Micromonospora ureilytica]MBG6067016.1 WD40 repeat protein/transcriptional regulator with XRE-family HTH domain [Micromonospora ureilytica]